jgi:hypothetical protein
MLADAGFPRAAGAPTALPTPKAGDGERGRDKARARPDTKGRELATVVRDQMLPTPRANDAEKRGNFDPTNPRNGLPAAVKLLPTPMARDHLPPHSKEYIAKKKAEGHGMANLNDHVAHFLPTPTTNDSKNASLPPSQAERDGLAGAMLRDDSIPTGAATYLNPSFVEEMMGFPVGWTV